MSATPWSGQWALRTLLYGVVLCLAAGCGDPGGGGGDDPSNPDGPVEVEPYEWVLPAGFPVPAVPADNPMTPAKVELGRHLFYDVRLSGNETQACGSCHQQALAFTDGRAHAEGSTGELHPRSAMSLTNIGLAPVLGWANPLLVTLEDQVPVPMFGEVPVELGLADREDEMLDRLRGDASYVNMFEAAFPGTGEGAFSVGNVVKAIASFERTLISGNSAYDRYFYGGDATAMSPQALQGFSLFMNERMECFHCHGGVNFADSFSETSAFTEVTFHNNGLYNVDGEGGYPSDNTGVFEITGDPADMGHFKAPTLRNIELTAPYMHDGSIETLEEVIDHYAAGGRKILVGEHAGDGNESPLKSSFVPGFVITADEKAALIAFLESLTDESFLVDPRFADPFAESP